MANNKVWLITGAGRGMENETSIEHCLCTSVPQCRCWRLIDVSRSIRLERPMAREV